MMMEGSIQMDLWWKHKADKTMGLNGEGRLASLSMSFILGCFENMTRMMNYEFSEPFWESLGINQAADEWKGKVWQ